MLLAVPNISEGRDRSTLDAIGAAFGPGLIHASADPDHHRSVFTVQGEPGALAETVLNAARVAVGRIDLTDHEGAHPRVGAIDVAPIVYLDLADRGAAVAEALVLADRLAAELGLPVFLYGALAGGRTRAELRKRRPGRSSSDGSTSASSRPTPGHAGCTPRPEPCSSPPARRWRHSTSSSPPPPRSTTARNIAARIREGGSEGLPGVRALGLAARASGHDPGLDQHRGPHDRITPGDVVARRPAPRRASQAAELVAPAPRSAFESFPAEIPLHGAPLLD